MFALARKVAMPRDKRNHWVGCVGRRRDGVLVTSRNLPCTHKCPAAHAEMRVLRKGAVEIWVVRISRATGAYLDSEPCLLCKQKLRGVKVHYLKRAK